MVAAIRAQSVNVRFDTVRLLVPDSTIAPESLQALLAVHGAFMSEILDCDPNKGFVAFPVALFDLDLSPGAFRTLAELCRMANTSGQCWPSLAQLGRRLGRSRASVSSYIAELRAASVLTTEEQKMANGYNYRLRYTVTFWKDWRASLGKEKKSPPLITAQKPERRVQQAERPLETKNHIHLNQQQSGGISSLVVEWNTLVNKAPYPAFETWPSQELIQRTEPAIQNVVEENALISADIASAFNEFAAETGLEPLTEIDQPALIEILKTKTALTAMMDALRATWQPHWKKPPNLYQLKRIVEGLPPAQDGVAEQKLLKSYMRRWKLYLRSLPSSAISSKVAA